MSADAGCCPNACQVRHTASWVTPRCGGDRLDTKGRIQFSKPERSSHEYFLTNSDEEPFPILLAFREWGEQQLHAGEPPVNPVWHKCGAELEVETVCGHCREIVGPKTCTTASRHLTSRLDGRAPQFDCSHE
jgi:hypothetical protein